MGWAYSYDWLKQYGAFNAGIPKHDTIARVICRLKADEIEKTFQSWISSLIKTTGCDVIAIDGKTARRSFSTKDRKSALHTVSAWSCQHQLVLGQTAVDKKTNKINTVPEFLTMLDIENSLITLDTMGCQQEITKQIIHQKADYILALKDSHSGMQSELEAWWHKNEREGLTEQNHSEHTEIDSGHGRIETRTCLQLLIDKKWLAKAYRWSRLKSIIKV